MDPFGRHFEQLCAKLDAQTAALEKLALALPGSDQQHSRQQRQWQPFLLLDGGRCDGSGDLTIGTNDSALVPAPNGWEAWLTCLVIVVGGASQAAKVQVYNGEPANGNLIDLADGLFGNTPSRNVSEYTYPGRYFSDGQALSVVVDAAVATADVIVRAEGRRRQV